MYLSDCRGHKLLYFTNIFDTYHREDIYIVMYGKFKQLSVHSYGCASSQAPEFISDEQLHEHWMEVAIKFYFWLVK